MRCSLWILSFINFRYLLKECRLIKLPAANLSNLIAGWHRGLPQIGVGGKITLYIPPSLAYGPDAIYNQGVEVIPANAYMIFDIELLNIQ